MHCLPGVVRTDSTFRACRETNKDEKVLNESDGSSKRKTSFCNSRSVFSGLVGIHSNECCMGPTGLAGVGALGASPTPFCVLPFLTGWV